VSQKIKLKMNHLKALEKGEDPMIMNEWVPTGPIISCNGCGKTFTEKSKTKGKGKRTGAAGGPKGLCGFCRYSQKNALVVKDERDKAIASNVEILKRTQYVSKKPEEWDQVYVEKFGMLKKATLLFSFRRYTDAQAIMMKAKSIVKSEQSTNDEKYLSLDKKWRAKLQISEEIPKEIMNYEISQEVIDYFQIKTPLSNLLVYVEKMRKGNCMSIYNRHTFLNSQILQFYKVVKNKIGKYTTDMKMIRGKIQELNTWNEKKEKLRYENPDLYKKFYRKYRAEMCPNIVAGKKCPDSFRDCKFAHNPNQLNLTIIDRNKKLLKNSLVETKKKTKQSKTIVPWKYPRQKIYEQGLKFDKTLIMKNAVENKLRSRSEKRSRSIDINKLRISFHEY
jgi:hypothetical protein